MTKLHVENDALFRDPDCYGPVVAHVLNGECDEDGEHMTARRLAACWNACAELDTEKLEAQNKDGIPLWLFVQEVIRKRDKLADDYRAQGLALQAAKAMQAGETERADKAEAQRDQLAGLLKCALAPDMIHLLPAEYVSRVETALANIEEQSCKN